MKIVQLIFVILFFLFLTGAGLVWQYQYTLKFDDVSNGILTVNGDEVVPKFSKDIKDYHSTSLSALTPNLMQFGNTTKKFNVKDINPQSPVIPFKIGNETYHLHVWSDNLSEFDTKGAKNVEDGHYFITSEWWDQNHTFPAYIVNKYGQILYYKYAIDKENNLKSTSDFKYTILSDGTILYSLIENETLFVMDKNFQPLFRTKLLKNSTHWELGLDGHHHVILGKDHFIIFATMLKEVLDAKNNKPIFLAVPIIQEIKDNKIIFEWNGLDYPELYENYSQCKTWPNGTFDYAHLNAIIIDTSDNNLILSFRGINTLLKIDRKDGHIIWQLSGYNDNFNLTKEQKFYGQHFPYIDKDGYLTVFDNFSNMMGEKNFIQENSSIKKFKLDPVNKKIVEYKKIPLIFWSYAMGSALPVKQGRYLVSAGSSNISNLCALEISENGNEVWRLTFKDPNQKRVCYYVYKRPFAYRDHFRREIQSE